MAKKSDSDRRPRGREDGVFVGRLGGLAHVDDERILERIVHARRSAAHGTFRPYRSAANYTRAAFLQDPGIETPVFVRFSTVAGGAGSAGLPSRDVHRFATKFYTSDGIFDLVGNNISMLFTPDETPDETTDEASDEASTPDTFWDVISLAPGSLHMVMWLISDRAIPRSYRMMEAFGVHTFRMIDAKGRATFIRWHWRPMLGTQLVPWSEAEETNRVARDVQRRDLFMSIQNVRFPAWELSIQPIANDKIHDHDLDLVDPAKLIREEQIPLVPVGQMVLDRWQNDLFAGTEHTACYPGQLVPGIELAHAPRLQRRVSSHAGAPTELLDATHRRQTALRPSGDHYSRARMFWRALTPPERRHIASAFTFELSKVEALAIRRRMLGHLDLIAPELGGLVADALGMMRQAAMARPLQPPREVGI